jgi:hypothetical protein
MGKHFVILATCPQHIRAFLRQDMGKGLAAKPDFKKASLGMPKGLGMLVYLDNRESYTRVYDYLLPFASAISAYESLGIDPGVLPYGKQFEKYYFGMTMGVKSTNKGITFTTYSPMGAAGFLVYIIDKVVLSSPATASLAAAAIYKFFGIEFEDTFKKEPTPKAEPKVNNKPKTLPPIAPVITGNK